MAARDLVVRFLGDAGGLGHSVDGVSSKMSGFSKTMLGVGAAVGGGLIAAGKGLLDIGQTFDNVSDTIRTQTGATGTALDGLVQSAKNVGAQVPSDFEQVGAAVAGLSQRLGLTGPALESVAAQVLNLSRMTGTDLTANIENVSRMFSNWDVSSQDMAGNLDKLYVVSQKTGIGFDALTTNMQKFGEPLRQLGFNFEQSAALIGQFEQSGLNTEKVLAGMGKALAKIAKDGEEPIQAFQRLVQSIKDAKTPAEALGIAVDAFGAKVGTEMAGAVRSGALSVDELVSSLAGSGGAIQAASADTADFAEQWQILKNRVFVALEPIAARLFGAINSGMQVLGEWFTRNQGSIEAWVGAVAGGFGRIAGAVGAVVAPVVSFGAKIFEIAPWLSAALAPAMTAVAGVLLLMATRWLYLGAVATVQSARVAVAWALSSVGAMGAAVTSAGAFAMMIGNWIRMGVVATASALRIAAAWLIAMGPIGWVTLAIVGLVALVIANWETVKQWTSSAWSAMSGFVANAWNAIVGFVQSGVDRARGAMQWFAGLPGMFQGWLNSAASAVGNGINAVIGWFQQLPGRVVSVLGNVGSMLSNAGAALVQGFWDGIVARWNAMVGWVSQGLASLRALFPGSPAKEGPFSGRGWVTHSGRAITDDFARSIRRGIPHVVRAGLSMTDKLHKVTSDAPRQLARWGNLTTRHGFGGGSMASITRQGLVATRGSEEPISQWYHRGLPPGGGAGAGGGQAPIRLDADSALGRLIMELIRKQTRTRGGGDAQLVIGRA